MAHSAKASKRADLDLGVSEATQQATADNPRPSSPLAPKKVKSPAAHDISSDTNASNQTAQEGNSRKRPTQASGEGDGPSKRQRMALLQAKNNLPANPSTTLNTSPQGVGILYLPTELHQHVLSFIPARDAARCRGVCRSTNQLVLGSEKLLLRTYAGGALSRLKKAVDEFNGLKTPHDADSLVEALHVWTKRRGQFESPLSSLGSLMKLMTHFYLKKDPNDRFVQGYKGVTCIQWAGIARTFVSLLLSPPKESAEEKFFSSLANYGFLDVHEKAKLLEHLENSQPQIADHPLSGQLWPREKLEYMTFPSRSWTLTPILKHPIIPSLEAPQVRNLHWPYDDDSFEQWSNYIERTNDHDALEQPGLGNEKVLRCLGLPALPNAVSCYYVSDRWAREQIEMLARRLGNASKRQRKIVVVPPLLKAAILQHVKYF